MFTYANIHSSSYVRSFPSVKPSVIRYLVSVVVFFFSIQYIGWKNWHQKKKKTLPYRPRPTSCPHKPFNLFCCLFLSIMEWLFYRRTSWSLFLLWSIFCLLFITENLFFSKIRYTRVINFCAKTVMYKKIGIKQNFKSSKCIFITTIMYKH